MLANDIENHGEFCDRVMTSVTESGAQRGFWILPDIARVAS